MSDNPHESKNLATALASFSLRTMALAMAFDDFSCLQPHYHDVFFHFVCSSKLLFKQNSSNFFVLLLAVVQKMQPANNIPERFGDQLTFGN